MKKTYPDLKDQRTPAEVLEVPSTATADEIRSAYLRKVAAHPPDRDPEEFERVRDAYEILRDPVRRVEDELLAVDPEASLTSVLGGFVERRKFVGPQLWLEAIREQ